MMTPRGGFLCTLLAIVAGVGCSRGIETWPLPAGLVTSEVVDFGCRDARARILEGFHGRRELDDSWYVENGLETGPPADRRVVTLYAEDHAGAAFGRRFFQDPANQADLYVHTLGSALLSAYYHENGTPLEYYAKFAIRLEDDRPGACRLSVRSFEAMAFHGKQFNGHVMGFVPKPHDVEPSPLDEERVLEYAARVARKRT